jgi:hypothetical protein
VVVSDGEVRALARAADEAHHVALAQLPDELAERRRPTTPPVGRRGLLRTAVGGAAVALGSTVAATRLRATTATAQELVPPPAGLDTARFTASIELAAAAIYDGAGARGVLGAPLVDLCGRFAGHHRDHAGAFNALLPAEHQVVAPNATAMNTFGPQLQAVDDPDQLISLLLGLEEAAVATYLAAVAVAAPPGEIDAAAAILPVEAQHAVALATVLGTRDDVLRNFERADGAMTLAAFPIGS